MKSKLKRMRHLFIERRRARDGEIAGKRKRQKKGERYISD